MNWVWQHWVGALVILALGIWVGRKTNLLSGLPLIG
jgi:hypothetical protein